MLRAVKVSDSEEVSDQHTYSKVAEWEKRFYLLYVKMYNYSWKCLVMYLYMENNDKIKRIKLSIMMRF